MTTFPTTGVVVDSVGVGPVTGGHCTVACAEVRVRGMWPDAGPVTATESFLPWSSCTGV